MAGPFSTPRARDYPSPYPQPSPTFSEQIEPQRHHVLGKIQGQTLEEWILIWSMQNAISRILLARSMSPSPQEIRWFVRKWTHLKCPDKTFPDLRSPREKPTSHLITLMELQSTRAAQDTRLLIAISCPIVKHERMVVMNHQTFQESAQLEREEPRKTNKFTEN